jgi:hypothetical protein
MTTQKEEQSIKSCLVTISAIAEIYEQNAIHLVNIGVMDPLSVDAYIRNRVRQYFDSEVNRK